MKPGGVHQQMVAQILETNGECSCSSFVTNPPRDWLLAMFGPIPVRVLRPTCPIHRRPLVEGDVVEITAMTGLDFENDAEYLRQRARS